MTANVRRLALNTMRNGGVLVICYILMISMTQQNSKLRTTSIYWSYLTFCVFRILRPWKGAGRMSAVI